MLSFRSLLTAVAIALALALGFDGAADEAAGRQPACACCEDACACGEAAAPGCDCQASGELPEPPALPPEAPAPQQSPSSARPTRVHEPWRLPLSFAPSGDARATVAATAEVRFGNDFRRGRRRHGVLSVWLE